jgi:hypothetical protein
MTKRKGARPSATQIVGGALVDLEAKIFRSVPTVEILVERGKDQAGLASDGSDLTIAIPDAPVVVPRPARPHSG